MSLIVRLLQALLLLTALWLLARLFERRQLYYPVRTYEFTPANAGLSFQDVDYVAEDGCRLHGWWIPHPRARGAIIIFHGNAGNIGDRVWIAKDLHGLECDVFLAGYRGYGRSRGFPSERGFRRDARAAYEVVRAFYNHAETPPVILYGRSLGAAVALELATRQPVRGLIMESPFSSTVAMGELLFPWLPVRWIVRDRYDNLSRVPAYQGPLLIAHSRDDALVPSAMGRELFAAAHEPKTFVELEGDHNSGGWDRTPAYWQALNTFIHRHLDPPSAE
ncbi:MAG: alpha/beta hydrolase [Candidatus Marinimicrobia bacterium]|nr:alpha/beta hydrolase [Candidatus Neomarinimicrobiota bacterium]